MTKRKRLQSPVDDRCGITQSMNRVTFFTKPDCTLCRSALFVVEKVRRTTPFELKLIDISKPGHEKWFEAYKHDIPVLHLNGEEILRHRVDEATLRGLLGKPE